MSPLIFMGAIALLGFIASQANAKDAPPAPGPDDLVPSPDALAASQKAPPATGQMPREYQDMLAGALKALTVDGQGRIVGPVTKESIQAATQVAGRLDKAGWPQAAQALRQFAQDAALLVPDPKPENQVPLPASIPADMQRRIQRMLQNERDPEKLQALVDSLRPYNKSPEGKLAIQMIKALIVQIETANVQREALEKADKVMKAPVGKVEEVLPEPAAPKALPRPAPAPAPVVTPKPAILETPKAPIVPKTAPVVKAPEPTPKPPVQIDAETMVANLMSVQKTYGMPGAKGKENKTVIAAFQKEAGLGADGMTGPGTLAKAATYGVAPLPLVMYWPKGANRSTVQTYRDTLRRLAGEAEAQGRRDIGNALRMSANYETGQGGISEYGPALV